MCKNNDIYKFKKNEGEKGKGTGKKITRRA